MLATVERASVPNPTPVGVGDSGTLAVRGVCQRVPAHWHTQQNQQTTGNFVVQCASVPKACRGHAKIRPLGTLKTRRLVSEHYRQQNELCARIIAADSVRYPPGSLMQEWADMILSKAAAPPADWEAGPLFAERAT